MYQIKIIVIFLMYYCQAEKISIMVLGCHMDDILNDRMETALKLAKKHPNDEITWYLSGGIKNQLNNKIQSCEANKMEKILPSNNKWKFELDKISQNTAENFLNFEKWIEENFFDRNYIVTSKFHYERANNILKRISKSFSKFIWILGDLDYPNSNSDEIFHSKNILSDVEKAFTRFYKK